MYFKKTRAKFLGWLVKATQAVNEENANKSDDYAPKKHLVAVTEELSAQKMTFNIYPGAGGVAIEVYQYDQKTDRSSTKLHIIPDSQDLGDALAKIITLEALR